MTHGFGSSRARAGMAITAALVAALTLATRSAAAQASPAPVVLAQVAKNPAPGAPDLTKTPTLFVVGYAHLDTEWRWDYPQVINDYLKATLDDNFALIEKYPHYIFNFTGANRYEMFKEYYPERYAQLKHYIAQGRWFPGGASMEENDVNSPNAESIIRQVLYGNEFFRKEFGQAAVDYMLPDCFGFPASLPSILSHAGLLGFSTQKLNAGWQPAAHVGGANSPEKTPEGIPFNVGIWTGPDGKSIIGAVNPGDYSGGDTTDLSTHPLLNLVPFGNGEDPVTIDGKLTGIYTDYHYVGTGDIGGSPDEESVKIMEATIDKQTMVLPTPRPRRGRGGAPAPPPPPPNPPTQLGLGPIHVTWADTDTMFLDMKNDDLSRLPRYSGDLELINHSAGSLTSEAEHKRWNRKNEILASAAEAASVGAATLAGAAYPEARLGYAWRLLLGGQFHDIMAGTADAGAYTYSWNDDILAANQFSIALTNGASAIARRMDTAGSGTPLVVFNPLNIARQDPVTVSLPGSGPVHAVGPDGRSVPAQRDADGKVVFLARVPATGLAVYRLAPGAAASSELKASANSIENARYRVTLNPAGDVASIFDKRLNRELLQSPMRLSFQSEAPTVWPAWNMDYNDQIAAPRAYVAGPAQVRLVERGPARVALQVTRDAEGSHFVQTVGLASGSAGDRVEFTVAVDWKTPGSALMADFPLTAANPLATYNWDIGTIQRHNDEPRQFEVASHQWVDLSDAGGAFGATLLTDVKNASDKPDDHTLRLTLLYTPGLHNRNYSDQATQDWGHHEITFGLVGHPGDWRGQNDEAEWQAYRLNEPLVAFATPPHAGGLGREVSLLTVSNPDIRVLALKKAEDSDEIVVRAVELNGQSQPDVHFHFAAGATAAREINGQEQPLPQPEGAFAASNGDLVASFTPYQPRSFAVKLTPAGNTPQPTQAPLSLTYDLGAATPDHTASTTGFDGQGNAYPAEMLPRTIKYAGAEFHLGDPGGPDAVTAHGQSLALPQGRFTHLYLLAAADGDQSGEFLVAGKPVPLEIQNWTGFIAQWDYRNWTKFEVPSRRPGGKPQEAAIYAGLNPGYIKRAPVAWFASHHHLADGTNDAYSDSYLFAYDIPLPPGATSVTLPNNPKIRIFAATASSGAEQLRPAQPLYDVLPYPDMTAAEKAALYTQSQGPDASFYGH